LFRDSQKKKMGQDKLKEDEEGTVLIRGGCGGVNIKNVGFTEGGGDAKIT